MGLPLLSVQSQGRVTTANVFTGPSMLDRDGLEVIGWLVLFTVVFAPALKAGIALASLLASHARRSAAWLPWLYGWLERIAPWAMVDVFLVGTFVAYTRLRALAHVEVGSALIALAGAMLTTVAVDATIDKRGLWASFRPSAAARTQAAHKPNARSCHVCGWVSASRDGARCPRCRHKVFHRKPKSLARAWALTIAAGLLYLPANMLPIMTVTRLGRGGPHTILGGVIELFQDKLWPLAVIVLLASIVVPVAKLLALTVMLVSTHLRATSFLLGRQRVLRVVSVIGRWSMIDIFALTVLVALVRMGSIATVLPGDGALAFAAVVVLTMFATESFDSRLMWDAAEQAKGRVAAPVGWALSGRMA
jgi:paraquat-inducible protein A